MAVDKPVLLTVRNAVIDGKDATDWAVSSQNQTNKDLNPKTLILEDCEIKNMTKKALYLTDVRSLTVKNCVFTDNGGSEDTGVSGDYGIDCNLVGVQGTSIKIEDCTFAGVQGHKACIKVTQRGYPSDKGAGDIPMDIPPAKISSLTVSGCDFSGVDGATTPIDVRIGTEHKTPEEPELYNGTGDFAVMVANNKSPVRVAVVSDDPATEVTVEVGQTGYKNAKDKFTVIGAKPTDPIVIGDKGYATLKEAIAAAKSGDTIILNENIVCNNAEVNGTPDYPVFTIPAGVTIDGNGHSIAADQGAWVDTNKNHILGAVDGTITIKNLTVIGFANTKSGIVLSGPTVVATLDKVTVKDCGNCGIQVTNGAHVTISNYTSSGNVWGSVNGDKGIGGNVPAVTFNSGTMAEDVEIYTELVDEDPITAVGFEEVIGVGTKLKGFKYFTSDMTRLGVAAVIVDDVTTVYEDMEEAQAAADEAGTEVIPL